MQYPGINHFKVIEIDIEGSEGETRDNLEKLTGARTTPRIFFSGQFFGGADELKDIHESGQLRRRLLDSGVIHTDERKCSSSLLSVASEKPYDEICSSMATVVPRFKYGVLHSYNLTQTLQSKGQNFNQKVSVFEVCNPTHANKVLSQDMSISNALPCRISIWQDAHNHTVIQSIKPSLLISMFGNDDLKDLAEQVENELYTIMLQLA